MTKSAITCRKCSFIQQNLKVIKPDKSMPSCWTNYDQYVTSLKNEWTHILLNCMHKIIKSTNIKKLSLKINWMWGINQVLPSTRNNMCPQFMKL